MFHKFDHYGNVNCVFTRVYASLSNKYKASILHLLVRQHEHLRKSNLTEKPSKYDDKDATAIRKDCHQNNYQTDSSCFTSISSASYNFHLKLKESLLILNIGSSLGSTLANLFLTYYEERWLDNCSIQLDDVFLIRLKNFSDI